MVDDPAVRFAQRVDRPEAIAGCVVNPDPRCLGRFYGRDVLARASIQKRTSTPRGVAISDSDKTVSLVTSTTVLSRRITIFSRRPPTDFHRWANRSTYSGGFMAQVTRPHSWTRISENATKV